MTTTRPDRRFHGLARPIAAAFVAALVALVALPANALASTAPTLGTATTFAVLAGTPAITNTGNSAISGDVGISPAAAVTGLNPLGPGTVSNGTIQAATSAAGTAKSDLTAAYGVAASSPCNFNRTGQNLGGLTLTPGTYCQTTAPTLTGTLTLSGNGVFIFQIGSTLVTAPGASVVLTNGAQACNVFWQVSSSATIDTTTTFVGTIMALTDISVNNGANITGRALAQNGKVTLINDTITVPTACAASSVPGPTTTAAPSTATATATATTPSPATSTSTSGLGTPHTGAAMGAPLGGGVVMVGVGIAFILAATAVGGRRRRRQS